LFVLTASRSTGKERDTESGLDYFGARYYASNMGRFMSPDWAAQAEPVPYAKLANPQSLNLYSYVFNNPLSSVDPDGHCSASEEALCHAITVAVSNGTNAGDALQAGQQAPQAQQQVSQAGQDFIKGYESLSLTVYDASKGKVKGGDWTIGYGHKTTKDAGAITLPEAEALFQGDVARMASHVSADLNVPVS
jgi:RHS repeat-associated protein